MNSRPLSDSTQSESGLSPSLDDGGEYDIAGVAGAECERQEHAPPGAKPLMGLAPGGLEPDDGLFSATPPRNPRGNRRPLPLHHR